MPRWAEAGWSIVQRIRLGTRRPANWLKLFKFGVVGASGYVVNLTVFAVLTAVLGAHHIEAAVGAFCVAVTNNFLWNRYWTFHDSAGGRRVGPQTVRFFTVSVLALGLNLVVLALLVDVLGLPPFPGQAIAVGVAMPANFIGNKMWTFGGELSAADAVPERAESHRRNAPSRLEDDRP